MLFILSCLLLSVHFNIIGSFIFQTLSANTYKNSLFPVTQMKHGHPVSSSNFPPELWLLSINNTTIVVDSIASFKIKREIRQEFVDSTITWSSCEEYLNLDRDGKLTSRDGKVIGAVVEINENVNGQNAALSMVGSVEWIVINCTGSWTMIPVENIIAACDGSGTKLAVIVDQSSQLHGVIFSLELGPHAIVLPPKIELWEEITNIITNHKITPSSNKNINNYESESSSPLSNIDLHTGPTLQQAQITAISSGSIGDRVCIDLIQLLSEGEGCLIGSSAKALVFVHGETLSTEFVPARPFRVNAGPVHSYILMNDGSTKYLSELVPGDMVQVVRLVESTSSTGSVPYTSRGVAVGRCKIEKRPMLLVQFSATTGDHDIAGQIFLQQAETVRIASPVHEELAQATTCTTDKSQTTAVTGTTAAPSNSGTFWRTLPVTQATVGSSLLLLTSEKGTHVGKRITAQVNEK